MSEREVSPTEQIDIFDTIDQDNNNSDFDELKVIIFLHKINNIFIFNNIKIGKLLNKLIII